MENLRIFLKEKQSPLFGLVPTNEVLKNGGKAAPGQNQPLKTTTPKPTYQSTGLYRADGRCGAQFPVEGTDIPAECDPNSEYWCCSENGWCGGEQEHCYCETCVNYRPIKVAFQKLAGQWERKGSRLSFTS